MKKISLILITFLLIFGVSGSYGYFVYVHQDDSSSSVKIAVQAVETIIKNSIDKKKLDKIYISSIDEAKKILKNKSI